MKRKSLFCLRPMADIPRLCVDTTLSGLNKLSTAFSVKAKWPKNLFRIRLYCLFNEMTVAVSREAGMREGEVRHGGFSVSNVNRLGAHSVMIRILRCLSIDMNSGCACF